MTEPTPFVREAGDGPAVLCLHSNASHSAQWNPLSKLLSGRYRVLAPDSFGSGSSPDWPSDRIITLDDEVGLLDRMIRSLDAPFFVVGHSYGAALALKLALTHGPRVAGLALFEPTLFSLIDAEAAPPNEADGIRDTVARAGAALDAGDRNLAAAIFIDYWMGPGSWDQTPVERQPAIASSVANVRRWGHALFTEPATMADFGQLRMPLMLMTGELSPASAQGVTRRLLSALPGATHHAFPGIGHMGPLTHSAQVNAVIAAFLDRLAGIGG